MKKLTRAILSVLLLASLAVSCARENPPAALTQEVPDDPAGEIDAGESDMNPYAYLGANYTEEGGALKAASSTDDKTVDIFSGAFLIPESTGSDSWSAEITVTLDTLHSGAGLLFCASASDAYDGVEGYAFFVRDKRAYLYDLTGSSAAGMVPRELAHKSVERPRTGTPFRLRVEKAGKTYRCYYLDDMEGVEPWPEFEYILTEHRGTGVGAIDNGHGASFSNLTVSEMDGYGFTQAPGTMTYRNPVFRDSQAADPGVLKVDGKYYCYSTSAPIGYYVYVSEDLVHWTNEGLCMNEAWGLSRSGYYWAPEVVQRADGKFVMVASVEEHLGFATADSPLGPFIPEPRWTFDKTIDGHIFLDEDGHGYLFCVSWREGHEYGIWAYALEDDLVTVKPETEVQVIRPTDAWEQVSGRVTEGPFVLKHNGKYYLTYSGNGYDAKEYAVGYAVADSPLGPYDKYGANPILSYTSKLYGPGHHSFTTSPDGSELIIVYHTHASTTAVHPRTICIDRARFAPTASGVDRLEIFGPTHTAQEVPK